MKSLLTASLLLIFGISQAQHVDWEKIQAAKSDKILLAGSRQPTPVLLLGTFHFNYPNLDGHKTDSSKFIDVKSPKRQLEMQELAEVILRFKPTRIYVESNHQRWIDSLYNEYLAGRYKLGRNEIFQVGFRVAGTMKHDKVYAVDTWPFSSEHYREYKWIDSLWNDETAIDSLRDQYWNKMYSKLYETGDSLELAMSLLETFLLMAEPEVLQRMHGHYLVGGFNKKTNAGADLLSIWWYNRNLRIFNNILKTRPGPDDRILVLFGNGHMPILKHCFYSSPEFQLVELKELVKKAARD